MKIAPKAVSAFIRAPTVSCVLVYGPNQGLAHERAQALTQGVLGADPDPFRLADIDAAAVADDPPLLFDEAAALSMTGRRRVVRLQGAGDGMTAAFAPLLEARAAGAIADESLVIAEAAALGKGSSLRQLFEGAKAGAALACYGDEDDGLESLIGGVLGTAGHATDADAIAWLTTNLGGDRGVTRGELEKLSLYAGAGAPITLSDAEAAIGDSAGLNLDDAALAAAAGDVRALDRALQTARIEGQSPVQVLRALARTLSRLHLAAGLRDAGASPTQAIAVLRPPVFFKQKQEFLRALGRWTATDLARAMGFVLEAEAACKTTGIPADDAAGRAALRIASAARRRSPAGP